jgi:hypothetical protein
MCQQEYHEPAGDAVDGHGGCTLKGLRESIAAAFGGKSWFLQEVRRQKKINRTDMTYEWTSKELFTISACNNPRGMCCSTSEASQLTDNFVDDALFDVEFTADETYCPENEGMLELHNLL